MPVSRRPCCCHHGLLLFELFKGNDRNKFALARTSRRKIPEPYQSVDRDSVFPKCYDDFSLLLLESRLKRKLPNTCYRCTKNRSMEDDGEEMALLAFFPNGGAEFTSELHGTSEGERDGALCGSARRRRPRYSQSQRRKDSEFLCFAWLLLFRIFSSLLSSFSLLAFVHYLLYCCRLRNHASFQTRTPSSTHPVCLRLRRLRAAHPRAVAVRQTRGTVRVDRTPASE